MLEKFLTVPQEEFNRYLRDAPESMAEDIDSRREPYRYSKVMEGLVYAHTQCR
jgi:hypothetical protein